MPTTLRQFAVQNRNGVQRTLWRLTPERFEQIQLIADASDAVFSNTANQVTFEVLASPTGIDANNDAVVIQKEQWWGGTYTPKGGGAAVPNKVDLTFGPFNVPSTWFLALQATFNRTMQMGGRLIGLP